MTGRYGCISVAHQSCSRLYIGCSVRDCIVPCDVCNGCVNSGEPTPIVSNCLVNIHIIQFNVTQCINNEEYRVGVLLMCEIHTLVIISPNFNPA